MFEIFRKFLEYARFKLTDIGFGIFVYLAWDVSDLFSGTFKNYEHIILGISSLAKLVDTRVFLIPEAFDSPVDFVQQNKIVFGERFLVFSFFLKSSEHSHILAFLAVSIGFSPKFRKFTIESFLHDRFNTLMRKNSSHLADPVVSVHANGKAWLRRLTA